jgi:hypothetical protein
MCDWKRLYQTGVTGTLDPRLDDCMMVCTARNIVQSGQLSSTYRIRQILH